MKVHPSQLVEGCVLLEDVNGKSGRPIMVEGTVLTEEHITVLKKFLVEAVDVSAKLDNGQTFTPSQLESEKSQTEVEIETHSEPELPLPFPVHYLQAVKDYQQFMDEWRNGLPIDISKVRDSIIPLLNRIEELDMEIFTLHQYGSTDIYHHNVAVSILSAFLGKESGYRKGEWIQIGLSGYLCDAGIVKVDSEINPKGDSLTESQQVKHHPMHSYRMVEHLKGLSTAAKIAILQHHERLDGTGYPLGLKEEKINTYARILAVCDTYYTLMRKHSKQPNLPIFKVMEELEMNYLTKLDRKIVQTLTKNIVKRSIGKSVILTNGDKGEIVYIDGNRIARSTLIRLHKTEEIIDLENNQEWQIVKFISG